MSWFEKRLALRLRQWECFFRKSVVWINLKNSGLSDRSWWPASRAFANVIKTVCERTMVQLCVATLV